MIKSSRLPLTNFLHKKDFMMIVEIPNWPLSSIESFSVSRVFGQIITNWVFSFFKSERQSIYTLIPHETLFREA